MNKEINSELASTITKMATSSFCDAKPIEYGKWYECKEGTMPEDILKPIKIGENIFTQEVIVPHLWGNEKGGGSVYPVMRYKVGNGKWKWFAFKGKPLYWMVLPPLPKTNLDGISSIEQLSKLFKLE